MRNNYCGIVLICFCVVASQLFSFKQSSFDFSDDFCTVVSLCKEWLSKSKFGALIVSSAIAFTEKTSLKRPSPIFG